MLRPLRPRPPPAPPRPLGWERDVEAPDSRAPWTRGCGQDVACLLLQEVRDTFGIG